VAERVLIEVAVETVEDALVAEAGGADRLELCAALDFGGLTPSLGTYLEIRAVCRLPVLVMIRPRAGDFVYSDIELRVMARDIVLFLPYRPDGFVFGPLNADGKINEDGAANLVRAAGLIPCVFHRAFDKTPKPTSSLNVLIRLGFKRILTSGAEDTALAGSSAIALLMVRAATRIEILPCGRIRANSVEEVVRVTGTRQIHGSFAEKVAEGKGRGHRGYQQRSRTSQAEIEATRAALDRLMNEEK